MVTNKEIEKAAVENTNAYYEGDDIFAHCVSSFKDGVYWVLDNLWHSIDEEPRKGTMCLIQMKLINGHGSLEYTTAIYIGEGKWTNIYISDDTDMKIIRWLYIDDLIVKN